LRRGRDLAAIASSNHDFHSLVQLTAHIRVAPTRGLEPGHRVHRDAIRWNPRGHQRTVYCASATLTETAPLCARLSGVEVALKDDAFFRVLQGPRRYTIDLGVTLRANV
jgi:hypothetical protein